MTPWIVCKFVITAALIVAISEVGKAKPLLGALMASIPLVSYLGMLWMKVEKADQSKIIAHSEGVFWLVLPSLPFFLMFPWMLKKGVSFYLSLGISTVTMILLYFAMVALLKKFGINA